MGDPASGVLPEDLHALKRWWRMPRDFADLRLVAEAAKFRVAHTELRAVGGRPLAAAAADLAKSRRRSP